MLFLFASLRRIVHCSWSSYHSFPIAYKLLAGRRRVVIPNGVNVERIDRSIGDTDSSPRLADDYEKLRILSVGRLIAVKNPFTLIEAVTDANLNNVTLEFLGDGQLREPMDAAICQSDLGNQIVLRGMIPRDQVYRELADADLYVSTSLGEGLPVAVMEAMGCGCPVILSDIPPHRELAESVDFIPLIDPLDSEGFSREIRRILSMSGEERAILGEEGRKLVAESFSLETMHQGYAELYAMKDRSSG